MYGEQQLIFEQLAKDRVEEAVTHTLTEGRDHVWFYDQNEKQAMDVTYWEDLSRLCTGSIAWLLVRRKQEWDHTPKREPRVDVLFMPENDLADVPSDIERRLAGIFWARNNFLSGFLFHDGETHALESERSGQGYRPKLTLVDTEGSFQPGWQYLGHDDD